MWSGRAAARRHTGAEAVRDRVATSRVGTGDTSPIFSGSLRHTGRSLTVKHNI
jgi:hypothetical protein